MLAHIDPQPTTCVDLINLTLRLDHRIAERSGQRNKADKALSQLEKSRESEGGAEAMEIGTIRSSLTKIERDLRCRNGLCMNCGKKGHYVRDCTTKPKRRDMMGRFKRLASTVDNPKEN